jgi:hypothetical protein
MKNFLNLFLTVYEIVFISFNIYHLFFRRGIKFLSRKIAQNNEYFNKTLLTKKNTKMFDLIALPEPFPTVLALLYGGTTFVVFITNITAVIILVKK